MAADYVSSMEAEVGDPAPKASRYSELMQAEADEQQTRVSAAAETALGVNPDIAAKAYRTAAFLNVHPGIVESAPRESERAATLKKLDFDTAAAPVLRKRYEDAEFAKLASDDSGVLSSIETTVRRMFQGGGRRIEVPIPAVMRSVEFANTVRRQMELNPALDADAARALVSQSTTVENVAPLIGPSRGPLPSVQSVVRGIFNPAHFQVISQGVSVATADILGLDPGLALRRYGAAQSRVQALTPEFETETGAGLFVGGVSTIQNLPGIALSVITGNPAIGLALAGGRGSGAAYGKYRLRQAKPSEAAIGAILEGAIEVATELLPMRFMVDRLGKAGASDFIKGFIGRDVPTEQLAELAQSAVDTAIANPDKTWADYADERLSAAYQTFLATLVQSGTIGAVNVALIRAMPQQIAAQRAEEFAGELDEAARLAQASKLRERERETFSGFINQLAQAGIAPAELYIDAKILANTLNQSGLDLETLRRAAPTAVVQMEGSNVLPGADVRIPVSELLAAGPELTAPLLDHFRESPNAMSLAESRKYLATEGEKIRADVENLLAERNDSIAFREQVRTAGAKFEQQLNAAGKFKPEVNKAYATLLGNYYAVQSLRAGMPLDEMLQRYELNVTGKDVKGRRQLSQAPVEGLTTRVTAEPINRSEENQKILDLVHAPGDRDISIRAEIAGEEVGYLDLAVREDGKTADVREVRVVPEYRRRGVATELYKQARAQGYDVQRSQFQTEEGAAFREAFDAAGIRQEIERRMVDAYNAAIIEKIPAGYYYQEATSNDVLSTYGDLEDVPENVRVAVGLGEDVISAGTPMDDFIWTKEEAPSEQEFYEKNIDPDDLGPAKVTGINQIFSPNMSEEGASDAFKILAESDGWDVSSRGMRYFEIDKPNNNPKSRQEGFSHIRIGVRISDHARTARETRPSRAIDININLAPQEGGDNAFYAADDWDSALLKLRTARLDDEGNLKFGERDASVFQDDRGALTFGEDITASPSVIALLKNADLSTFIHESGHFFLEVQSDLAARIELSINSGASVSEGERQIVADMNRILGWFGITADARQSAIGRWLQMPLEEKREFHEKWARGFERYAMEGKAPSQELQILFARFRAWLVRVYKNLRDLNATLTDDVRQVMDRMLASDAAISEMQAARNMGPLFQSAQAAGMTPEEYVEYQSLAERSTANASAELDAKLLRDMRWLSGARDKAMKAAQAEAKNARAEVRREISAQVMAEPVYRAWTFLTGKADIILPGTVAPQDITGLESGRLRSSLAKAIDPISYERLSDLRMTNEDKGLDPDIVAEVFGFASGQQLMKTLATAPKPSAIIDELVDFEMMQRYGDIYSKEGLDRAANEAVHNEMRARVIATELKALAKAGKVMVSGDGLIQKRDVVNAMTVAARRYANDAISRKVIKDLRPAQYVAAEARSAKEAEQALGKDLQEAAMHKRNQLVNNYAAKAAFEAQEEIKKGVELFRKILHGKRDTVSKNRDWDVVQAIRAILAEYGMGPKGEAAQKYLEIIGRNDPSMHAVLRDRVDAMTVNAKPLDQITVEEFRGLLDDVKGLWRLAKRNRQIEIDGKLIDIDDAKMALIDRMKDIGIPARMPGEGRAVTASERLRAGFRTLIAALTRVESWVETKDGGSTGPFRKFIFQPIKEAANNYRTDKRRYLNRYLDLLAVLDVGQERIEASELGYTFGYSRGGSGKAEILHALLHTGNNSNKRKLLLGRGWATESDAGILDTSRWDAFVQRMINNGVLTKTDFDFAQGVWDMLEDMKPIAQKTHRDVFGRYFDEVTADSFNTPFGVYRGGYVPAMTDAEVVKDAATRALQEDENQTLAYAFPTTSRGFTKTRVENNKPLLLDLRMLSTHIDKVLLFSHLEQPVREIRKILTSKEVSTPLHRLAPEAFDSLLTPWLNRAARQLVETPVPGSNGLMRFFTKARSRAGIAALMANSANTAQQITGFPLASVKVRPKYLVSAMAEYVINPRKFAMAVAASSQAMDTRMNHEIQQMGSAIDEILLNPSVYENLQAWTERHAYFMQAAVDNVVGSVVWMAAYNQSLEQDGNEKEALRFADATVRQTQGSTLPEDVSRIETGTAFVRIFTQFASYFNMQANLLGAEFIKSQHEAGLRRGMGRGLYIFTMGFLVPAMLSEMIVQAFRGGPDDEDRDGTTVDDWLMTVLVMGNLRAALGMVPGAGQAINALVNSFNKKPYDDRISTAPAISMIESAVRAPNSVYEAVAEDGDARRAVRDMATLITMTTGLPATAIARPVGYLAAVQQGNVEPVSGLDVARGLVTGVPSPESKR